MSRRKLSKMERLTVYNKMHGHCAYCGCDLEYKNMQVDHVVAINRGGADILNNMLPACRSCNHYKSTLTVNSFRKTIEKMPDTLMRDNVTYKNAVRYGLVIQNSKPVVFYFEEVK